MKRYPKYKDSGVPWLGQVPAHWEVKRLKRVFSEVTEKARSGDEQLAATQKYGVISQSQFMKAEDQKLVLALKGTENFKHVDRDDFVISLRAFEGGIERSNQPGCVSPAYTVLRSNRELAPGYSARLLKTPAFISQISMTYDGIREGKAIKFKDAGPVFLPIPPLGEQAAIIDFIDDTVAQMDAAISSQERMIELLKERRSAIITQAVTKGLDPKAKMKDSGVPWLGQVPTHWKIQKVKYVASVINGYPFDSKLFGFEGHELIRIRDIASTQTETKYSGAWVEAAVVSKGDVLVGMDGDFNVSSWRGQRALLNQRVCCMRGFDATSTNFLRWAIVRPLKLLNDITYSTTVKHLSSSDLLNLNVAIPPIHEMDEILKHVEKMDGDIATAIASQERLIELLRERRSAIITQAVTGQIDVR